MIMEYTLIRSERKKLTVSVKADGRIAVRAPHMLGTEQIEAFLSANSELIMRHAEEAKRKNAGVKRLTEQELSRLFEKAEKVIPEKAAHFAEKIGVTYSRITIRAQRTRWGSCSVNGNLSFNALLMLMPDEVIDSVVIHELCHRKEMNHQAGFYELLYSVCPDYDKCRAWLKEHGGAILRRLGG